MQLAQECMTKYFNGGVSWTLGEYYPSIDIIIAHHHQCTFPFQLMQNFERTPVGHFQEMLSRSSLETQKLELMSAMSELKLQQAALERENLELRTSHMNNNSIMTRRPPMAPSRALAAFPATPPPHGAAGGGSLTSTPLGGSHGNLQQHSSSTPATPKVLSSVSLARLFLLWLLNSERQRLSHWYCRVVVFLNERLRNMGFIRLKI